jgi:drug/metabolite transporter (DMT)-like permease
MDGQLLGETSALLAALSWTANSILFSAAGRRIGAISVNALRIVIAVVLLGTTHIIFFGTILPAANSDQWFWMGVSGIIGLGLGDFALFAAFVVIGPRKSLLLMSLAPVCSALGGYLILGEVLGAWAVLGIAITLVGIIIVIMDKEDQDSATSKKWSMYGIALGVMGAVGQGIGLVISKYGMINVADNPSVPLHSLSATFIRMFIGAIFVWIVVLAIGKLPELKRSFADRRAVKLTSGGAFVGPFIGVWLSMVAVTYTHVGIAMTLMSLMPIFIIPVVWFLYKEETSCRGIFGALVAVLGVAILFLF